MRPRSWSDGIPSLSPPCVPSLGEAVGARDSAWRASCFSQAAHLTYNGGVGWGRGDGTGLEFQLRLLHPDEVISSHHPAASFSWSGEEVAEGKAEEERINTPRLSVSAGVLTQAGCLKATFALLLRINHFSHLCPGRNPCWLAMINLLFFQRLVGFYTISKSHLEFGGSFQSRVKLKD